MTLGAAGNETTRNSISWGLTYLTANPEQKALLQSDLDTHMPGAVEEIVRHASPVIHFRRTVTQDGARLGDTVFNEGDKVVLFYGSGNRDDAVFDDPDAFDLHRPKKGAHIAFGSGIHHCVGSELARVEMRASFAAFTRRFRRLELLDDDVTYHPTFALRGIEALNLRCVSEV